MMLRADMHTYDGHVEPVFDVDDEALTAMRLALPSTTAAFEKRGWVRVDSRYARAMKRLRGLLARGAE